MKTFVISDTHFNHENVIRYSNRPYSSVEEMNEFLIANWNDVVGSDDVIICLGDFALGKKEDIPGIVARLNGIKILVRGNHDRNKSFYEKCGFNFVCNDMEYTPLSGRNNRPIIFSHHPRLGMSIDEVNIHGHIHEKELDETFDRSRYFNASVENINYTPIDLQEIIKQKGW